MSDAPEHIWLSQPVGEFRYWWPKQLYDTDARYIRADIAERDLAEARAEIERWAEQALKEEDCRKMWQAERDRLAAELRNDQAELKRLMRAVPGAHFCQDWDGLLVWPGTPEADACTCASLQTGEKGQ